MARSTILKDSTMIFVQDVNCDAWVAYSDDRQLGQHLGICFKTEDSSKYCEPGVLGVPELRSHVFLVAGKVLGFIGQWIDGGMRQRRTF